MDTRYCVRQTQPAADACIECNRHTHQKGYADVYIWKVQGCVLCQEESVPRRLRDDETCNQEKHVEEEHHRSSSFVWKDSKEAR